MNFKAANLNHVAIVVSNLEASVEWYVQKLGFRRLYSYSFPGAKVAFIALGDFRLEIFQTDGASPMSPERETPATNLKMGGINHFALGVDDLDGSLAALRTNGVEIVTEV